MIHPSSCKMCEWKIFELQYHPNINYCKDTFNCDDEEHIHYYCKRCNYDWTGPTANTQKLMSYPPEYE